MALVLPCLSGLTLVCGWFLFSASHPVWFELFALAIAAAHFAFAFRLPDAPAMYSVLYLTGQACLIWAALSAIDLAVTNNIDQASRGSVISQASSLFLAFYGIVALAYGIVRRSPLNRTLGLAILGLVTAKLYLWDVWFLVRFYRTTAFVILGIVLLTASYIYSRWRSRSAGGS